MDTKLVDDFRESKINGVYDPRRGLRNNITWILLDKINGAFEKDFTMDDITARVQLLEKWYSHFHMMLGNEHCTWDHEINKVQAPDWLIRFWNDVAGDAEFTAAYLKHGEPLFGLMDRLLEKHYGAAITKAGKQQMDIKQHAATVAAAVNAINAYAEWAQLPDLVKYGIIYGKRPVDDASEYDSAMRNVFEILMNVTRDFLFASTAYFIEMIEPTLVEILGHYLDAIGPFLRYNPDADPLTITARRARLQISTSFIRLAKAASESLLPHMKKFDHRKKKTTKKTQVRDASFAVDGK
ncbi:protein hasty 1 [Phtheirospermum japonicum]|uniref:Protein hasty 1 n=1 Tax=Phtheirospermum japonicum TaxID=374723 RepID=A0A830CEK9_9LAMI|nr:protein hasty 1 [Phtheirospermum japonicum]